ncbi:MAG TPA: ABC transporter ATP-binding protein [Candidatus Limnocylindrales bacterium]|nr:ABC transporter ATP-binding protein [Candidatus Limnocylindrales bacterium]
MEIEAGEVHALLGQNGAGKTTLMNILYGLYQPDFGQIYFKDQKVKISSPRKAIELGIGMVHQHFMLIPDFTVVENILIGFRQRGPFLNLKKVEQAIAELSRRYRLQVDPTARVQHLSVGSRQRVEIIKALYRGAELLILDEPTSVLTPQETQELFQILHTLATQGKSVIFITHKLNEVMQVCDRATVLRNGRKVGTVKIQQGGPEKEVTKENLARMMIGKEVSLGTERMALKKKPVQFGKEVLKVEELETINDQNRPVLKKISFSVRAGEIFGIAGVAGNGQSELVEVLAGLRKAVGGRVFLNGQEVLNEPPGKLLERGIAHIPEDRLRMGLVLDLPLPENAILGSFHKAPFSFKIGNALPGPRWLNYTEIRKFTERLILSYDIKTPHPEATMRMLSGGNQQKFIVGRELTRSPKVLLTVQPTMGLDIEATEFVHQKLLEQRENQVAILLISTELDEILALSDRVAVLYEGQIVGLLPADQADREILGRWMSGL